MKWVRSSFVDDDGIGSFVVGCIFGGSTPARGIDGNPNNDGATVELFTLEGIDGFLLFGLITNVDEAVTLALSVLTPTPSDDASRNNFEAGVGEESGQSVVFKVEAKVGNKEDSLGWLSNGVFTDGAGTTEPGPAGSGPAGSILCTIGFWSISIRGGGLSLSRLGLVATLRVMR